ncbi:MAG: dioxygenase [Alphaproteobacteria bacterium]|nr:dioxygenase [Alphaproteobacteria bacterium]
MFACKLPALIRRAGVLVSLSAIYVSHGSPMTVADPGPARDFLARLAALAPAPRAILVASAHWLTRAPMLGGAPALRTIHDFYGFPRELYALTYPAKGAPCLAERACDLLAEAGFAAGIDGERGLDHGAWTPLMLGWPAAEVPIVPLSIQPEASPAHHFAVGVALRPLAQEGVLVLASGSATHNLSEFRGQAEDAPVAAYAQAFDDWLAERVTKGDEASLLDYRRQAPNAARAHPTDEHLLPLYIAAGAGGLPGRALHRSFAYGIISMAAYGFGSANSATTGA